MQAKPFSLTTISFLSPPFATTLTSAYDIKVVSLAEQHKITTPGEVYFAPPADPTTEAPQEVTIDKALGAGCAGKIDGMGEAVEVTEV